MIACVRYIIKMIQTYPHEVIQQISGACEARLSYNYTVCEEESYLPKNLEEIHHFISFVDISLVREIECSCKTILAGHRVPEMDEEDKLIYLYNDPVKQVDKRKTFTGKLEENDIIKKYPHSRKYAKYINGQLIFQGRVIKSLTEFDKMNEGEQNNYVHIKKAKYNHWCRVKSESLIL